MARDPDDDGVGPEPGHDHGHNHGHGGGPVSRRMRVILAVATVPFLVAALAGMAALWPREPLRTGPPINQGSELVDATVVAISAKQCPIGSCVSLTFTVDSGPDAGRTETIPQFGLPSGAPTPTPGQPIVVSRTTIPGVPDPVYNWADHQRSAPMILLVGLFVVATIAVGRRSGVGALLGLGASYVLLTTFAIPAILSGRDPMLVALVSGTLIMFLVLYLASGINARITTALLGTLLAIGLTAVLAKVFVALTRLTGLSSEEASYLQVQGLDVSLSGVLLAGVVIGTLGALNDVTVTQASAVWEVHRADPTLRARDLYRSGMRVGRDHIASTIDTLVLAYAGASLPLLLLFSLGTLPFQRVITGELVAEEVIRALIGSLGLIASVPITTVVAALVVSAERDDLP